MNADPWSLPEATDDRPTFFSHALSLGALYGRGPWPRGGYPLPDEDPDGGRPLMSGAVLDGVQTHHSGHRPDPADAAAVVGMIEKLVSRPPTSGELWGLHEALAGQSTLGIADALTEEVRRRDLPRERLRAVARWLTEQGGRRGAVAVGIVLLGLAGDDRDRDLLLLLGALEDLSLYAVVALIRSQADRERAVYDLARRVEGWGRIHAVERLKGTQDPEIKAWLLRDGFRNGVMNEYLAHLAATTGDLYQALTDPVVDDALLDGAGDILVALCLGGPAEDMSDYPDGPAVIDRYLALVGTRPPTLARVAVVLRLGGFLSSASAPRLDCSDEVRTRLRSACDRLADQASWKAAVEQALDDDDPATFRLAIWPARQLNIATRDRIRNRLLTNPLDGYLWQSLTDDIDDVLTLATRLLPLAELDSGPSTEIGLRADRADHILDLIVSRLDNHPGKGWPLIKVALNNRTIRNRNMAVRALKAWPAELIPHDAIGAVARAAQVEPDAKVRENLRQLLSTLGPPD